MILNYSPRFPFFKLEMKGTEKIFRDIYVRKALLTGVIATPEQTKSSGAMIEQTVMVTRL
jgi:hypothetical protein